MRSLIRFILALCFVSAAATGAGQAQDDERLRIDTRLVSVHVSVTDSRGRHVPGLTRDRFEIFDNKARREVAHFSAEEAPFSIGIVYDIHPSTPERVDAALRAIKQFTATLRGEDDFFLMVFNERGSVVVEFVPTADQVTNHLTYAAPKGPASLYDAAFQAAERLRSSRNVKKALLIISDGEDHDSGHSDKDVRDRARDFQIQVYGIGVADPADDPFAGRGRWVLEDITGRTGRRAFPAGADASLGRAALDELSRTSGGTAYFPGGGVKGEQELAAVCAQIALELRRQYALAFYPAEAPGAGWHKLSVRVTPPAGSGKLRLTYRKAYRPPER
ncbi:MAG TPA: VWA domain-containing protein [Pyrinomonadaceae bacterium]